MDTHRVKQLVWIASSKKDLLSLPDEVIKSVGYSLHCAQAGLIPPWCKSPQGVPRRWRIGGRRRPRH